MKQTNQNLFDKEYLVHLHLLAKILRRVIVHQKIIIFINLFISLFNFTNYFVGEVKFKLFDQHYGIKLCLKDLLILTFQHESFILQLAIIVSPYPFLIFLIFLFFNLSLHWSVEFL